MKFTACLALVLTPALYADDVLVVDASGGGAYTDLQAAADAASDGDILLVKQGNYGPLNVLGKGLTISADVGHIVTIFGGIVIRSTEPDQPTNLIGLRSLGGFDASDLTEHGAIFNGCDGPVRVEGCAFKVIAESDDHSAYQMAAGGRIAEIHFHVASEQLHLPVALASMTSKYLRELFMQVYNLFWAEQVPGISPTAGYYADGKRFYEQILLTARTMGIDQQTLYRLR